MKRIAWMWVLASVAFATRGSAQDKPKLDVSFQEKRLAVVPEGEGRLLERSELFSPDGKSVAFVYLTQPPEGEKHRVVEGDFKGEEFNLVHDLRFTPDGKTLAYRGRHDYSSPPRSYTIVGRKRLVTDRGEIDSVVFSPDGNIVAYTVRDGGASDPADAAGAGTKMWVVAGGKKGEEYDAVGTPIFSRDWKTMAYAATKGGKSFVVVGESKGEEFDGAVKVTFNPDGKTVSYMAMSGDKWRFVVGSKKGEEFDTFVHDPVFSPDGSTFRYTAVKDGKVTTVVGEKKLGEGFEGAFFCPDGKNVACVVSLRQKQCVVVGDKKGEEFDEVQNVRFRSDGKTPVYLAKLGRKAFIVDGDRKGEEFDFVDGLRLSPDGKTAAYVACKGDPRAGGKWFVVVGEKKWNAAVDLLESLLQGVLKSVFFSPDGKSFAYVISQRGLQSVVVGEKKGEAFGKIVSEPRFGGDNKTVVYVANSGTGQVVVIGEKKGEEFWGGVSDPVFSPDGKSVAYKAKSRVKEFVVLGDQKSEEFDRVSTEPVFSPDSRKLAYGVVKGREFWWKVVEVKP